MIDLKSALASNDKQVCDLYMDQVAIGCLTALDELNVFEEFNEKTCSADEIAKSKDLEPEALRRVFRVLTSMGFLECRDDCYRLSEVTRSYFVRSSPTYRGFQFYSYREHWAHKRVVKTLKQGWAPAGENRISFTEMWEKGELSKEAADRFTGMMHTNISGPAISIAKSGIFDQYDRIVDVGGGSGIFLASLLQHFPQKQVGLLELPQVCESARKILSNYVSIDSITFYELNFFTPNWPIEADALFLSNIMHDWSFTKGAQILKNAHDSLDKDGAIFVNECLLDDSGLSPKHTVVFDLMMYMNHRSQQYTKSGLFDLLLEAGFYSPHVVFEFGYYSVVKALV